MITQNHKTLGINRDGSNTYFVIASSEAQLYNEIQKFVDENKNDTNAIWCHFMPAKLSKENFRPEEYSVELQICDKYDGCTHLFQQRLW